MVFTAGGLLQRSATGGGRGREIAVLREGAARTNACAHTDCCISICWCVLEKPACHWSFLIVFDDHAKAIVLNHCPAAVPRCECVYFISSTVSLARQQPNRSSSCFSFASFLQAALRSIAQDKREALEKLREVYTCKYVRGI